MDLFSPEQYLAAPLDQRSRQAFDLLRGRYAGTLAMATGGCARYVFCSDVNYCLDRRGRPLIHYSSPNPHHHLILTNTTMTLRLPHRLDADGNEHSILILTGLLSLVDPGDHDSLDRHHRFFGETIENYTRGTNRLYRLDAETVCFELFSGQRLDATPDLVLRRNLLAAREEEKIIEALNAAPPRRAFRVVGLDGYGLDLRGEAGWIFRPYSEPVTDKAALTAAALAVL